MAKTFHGSNICWKQGLEHPNQPDNVFKCINTAACTSYTTLWQSQGRTRKRAENPQTLWEKDGEPGGSTLLKQLSFDIVSKAKIAKSNCFLRVEIS